MTYYYTIKFILTETGKTNICSVGQLFSTQKLDFNNLDTLKSITNYKTLKCDGYTGHIDQTVTLDLNWLKDNNININIIIDIVNNYYNTVIINNPVTVVNTPVTTPNIPPATISTPAKTKTVATIDSPKPVPITVRTGGESASGIFLGIFGVVIIGAFVLLKFSKD